MPWDTYALDVYAVGHLRPIFSPYVYRHGNQVKRFFNRIKHCRRIATRYGKHAVNFLAFIKLAAIRLWLRVYESTS